MIDIQISYLRSFSLTSKLFPISGYAIGPGVVKAKNALRNAPANTYRTNANIETIRNGVSSLMEPRSACKY